ncbi:hypothetical protein HJC23_012858 [Cyclotella cryptica]|uniref:Enoyl reductase (ER) domain-containing protein n=1 Tax=Cyclotella cryptica TaxID=29204 RepID=A0ABD3Q3T7_9STRA|eukprot:CCRYP_009435-RA/>CCRYP_009435-RA protein AED:0.06 eAED:0.06 QI:458/1/1/1/1/1/4/429/605
MPATASIGTTPNTMPPSQASEVAAPQAKSAAAADTTLDGILAASLSIDQVHVNPTDDDDVSEYSGGSALSYSHDEESVEDEPEAEEKETLQRVDRRGNAVPHAKEDSRKRRDNNNNNNKEETRRHNHKSKSGTRGEEAESLCEFSTSNEAEEDEDPNYDTPQEKPRSKRRHQRQRRHHRHRDTDDQDSTSDTQSIEINRTQSGDNITVGSSPSAATSESGESLLDRNHNASYDSAESSSFQRAPQVENVKKTNEKCKHKDIMIHGPGGTSALMVRAMYYVPLPRAEEDVVIKVEASTVSFRDCLLRRNLGMYKAPFPFVPGCQSVGTITSLGRAAKSQGFRAGDRVMAAHPHGGGNAKYVRYDYKHVTLLTSNIDAPDAACLGEVYITAYQALRMGRKDGTPLTGSNVLVTDGFSPVGQAAIQLAKCEGAKVFVTITDARQESYVQSLGVRCLPSSPSKWLPKIKGMMDIVIDNTCFDSYDSSWKALNNRGVLVCTGMTSIYNLNEFEFGGECGCGAFGDRRDIEAKWARMKAKYIMSQTKFYDFWEQLEKEPKMYEQELKYLCFLVEDGRIKPKIAERVTIEEVPDAQRYLETGKANGSIICLP